MMEILDLTPRFKLQINTFSSNLKTVNWNEGYNLPS